MGKRVEVNFSAVEYYTTVFYDEDAQTIEDFAKEHHCLLSEAVDELCDAHVINLWDNYDSVMSDDVAVDDAELVEDMET